MKTPIISVIVPVYRVERYLARCLDSLLAQTYRTLDIILVDDGSPDTCGAICDSYAESDLRIRVIHRENGGLSAARNSGLEIAKGEYIAFLDSDDWIYPEMYEYLYGLLMRYQANMAQCGAESNVTKHRPSCEQVTVLEGKDLVEKAIMGQFTVTVWCNLYHASIWQNLRFEEGYYYEDSLALPHIAKHCGLCVKSNRILYYYTRRNSGILRRTKDEKHLESQQHVYQAFMQLAEEEPEIRSAVAYYICANIPSYRQLVQPGPNITRARAQEYNRAMHRMFRQHYRAAKLYSGYLTGSRLKKMLWALYNMSPALERVVLKFYKQLSNTPEETEA